MALTFPVYFHVGSVALHPPWVFEMLAYGVGLYLCSRARKRGADTLDSRARWTLIAAAFLGGIAGSRMLASFEDPRLALAHWRNALFFVSGKTIVGGLIGGVIAVELMKRRLHIQRPTGDLLALPLIVGIAVGRVGCFLSGLEDESYGVPTRLPWGVDFGDGVARHPAQLYEVVFLAALGFLLVRVSPRLRTGDQFKLFLMAYLTFRLLIDFIKPGVRLGGLSAIQWMCAAALAFYAPHVRPILAEVRHE